MNAAPPETPTLTDYHASGVITDREREALALRFPDWPSAATGLSRKNLALALGLSRSAAHDRVWNGLRKIAAHEETNAA